MRSTCIINWREYDWWYSIDMTVPDSEEQFSKAKARARELFIVHLEIYNAYFGERIILNSDGFHHRRYSSRRECTKKEQLLKSRLLRGIQRRESVYLALFRIRPLPGDRNSRW